MKHILVISLLFSLASILPAQETRTISISITVSEADADGNPLDGADVTTDDLKALAMELADVAGDKPVRQVKDALKAACVNVLRGSLVRVTQKYLKDEQQKIVADRRKWMQRKANGNEDVGE